MLRRRRRSCADACTPIRRSPWHRLSKPWITVSGSLAGKARQRRLLRLGQELLALGRAQAPLLGTLHAIAACTEAKRVSRMPMDLCAEQQQCEEASCSPWGCTLGPAAAPNKLARCKPASCPAHAGGIGCAGSFRILQTPPMDSDADEPCTRPRPLSRGSAPGGAVTRHKGERCKK